MQKIKGAKILRGWGSHLKPSGSIPSLFTITSIFKIYIFCTRRVTNSHPNKATQTRHVKLHPPLQNGRKWQVLPFIALRESLLFDRKVSKGLPAPPGWQGFDWEVDWSPCHPRQQCSPGDQAVAFSSALSGSNVCWLGCHNSQFENLCAMLANYTYKNV